MSVLVDGEGRRLLLTKGAPESVLARCSHALVNDSAAAAAGGAGAGAAGGGAAVPMTESVRRSILRRSDQFGGGRAVPCSVLAWCATLLLCATRLLFSAGRCCHVRP